MGFLINPYIYQSGWDFQDNFSGADAWTDTGSGIGVNTTTDVMDWNALRNGALNGSYYDLGLISETEWLLRFKLTVSALTTPSGNCYLGMVISDNATSDVVTNQDAIGLTMQFVIDGSKVFHAIGKNGTSIEVGQSFATAFTTTTYYIQVKRTSATSCTVGIYSDSAFSTLTEEEVVTITSGITGLRYIKFVNFNATSSTGVFNGTIDDIQFIDGQSTPP
jgi:hypothetical protein